MTQRKQKKYTYEDIEVEDFLLELFLDSGRKLQTSIDDVVSKCADPKYQYYSSSFKWGCLYHLSSARHNLLNWYPFESNKNVLEIGAGCGAITGLLCERLKEVTANELSEKRAEITRRRYKGLTNIKVEQGNIIEQQETEENFDYVTVIGVLEYSGRFIKTDSDDFFEPYREFLRRVFRSLKDDGHMLLAIENKLGIKYLTGGREDHYGR